MASLGQVAAQIQFEFLAHNDLHLSVHLAQVSEGIPPPLPLFEGNIPDFGNDNN